MKGLSSKEIEIVSFLEFEKNYFFTREDIASFFSSYNQTRHTLHKLIQKKRIISLNRNKYYLIPIKAKSGGWSEDSYILADEIFNGKDYFIGGWSAANYWRLSEQIPMKIEVYSTKRQGNKKILSTNFIFRRTTKNMIEKAVARKINNHQFIIMNKREMKKWMKSRN
jgi:predicted transcriptional regulator of viral defense system